MGRADRGVGIVGLSASGSWAGAAHVAAINAVEGLELRAVAGSSPESGRAAATAFGVPAACDSLDEMLERREVDIVVVSVRVPRHYELVAPILEAGRRVFCEWPLARTTDEARVLTAAAPSDSFVGLQGRSAPVSRFVRDLVADGLVGDVQSTSVLGSAPPWGGPVDERNAYLLDRVNGATMLTIPTAHTVDTVESVLGDLVSVTGTMAQRREHVPSTDGGELPLQADDQVVVSGRLASGAVASIHYRGGSVPTTAFRWEIQGDTGSLEILNNASTLNRGDVVVRVHRAGEPPRDLSIPAGYDRFPDLRGTQAHVVAHAYAAIAGDLESGTRTAPRFSDALRLHELLRRAQDASRDQARVPERSD